jgi:hypothetical protein
MGDPLPPPPGIEESLFSANEEALCTLVALDIERAFLRSARVVPDPPGGLPAPVDVVVCAAPVAEFIVTDT